MTIHGVFVPLTLCEAFKSSSSLILLLKSFKKGSKRKRKRKQTLSHLLLSSHSFTPPKGHPSPALLLKMPHDNTTPPPFPSKLPPPPYHHLHPPKPMKHQPSPFPAFQPGPLHGPQKAALLRPHRHTNPAIWCLAILFLILSLVLILSGILTLVIFLLVKPKTPSFDIPAASLNAIYLDSPSFLNNDLRVLANFTNPNTKLDLTYESLTVELYYRDRLVSAQGLGPFKQGRRQWRLETVHMISSEVYLPPEVAMEMVKEVRSSRVVYSVRGSFKVRASFGVVHVSYWVYGRCLIELTPPPAGVLVARRCRTKR